MSLSIVVCFLLWLEVGIVTDFLNEIDTIRVGGQTADQAAVTVLQGVLIGLFSYHAYDEGERYFRWINQEFDSKEVAFSVKIGLLGAAGFIFSITLPDLVQNNAEFVVMQTGGASVTLGYILMHLEISNWRLWNELPIILAGGIFAAGPVFVM